jgi:uncharacterized damage-inducible protein DinB
MAAHVPPTGTERESLAGYLAHQRYLVRVTAYGLTDAQAALTPTASALSIGGLIKHLAQVERSWMDVVLQRPRRSLDEVGKAYMDAFRVEPGETLSAILEGYAASAHETDEILAGIAELDQRVPVPHDLPWFPKDVDAWSVRWVVLHLIEETARHAGHADIVRESIDGAAAIPLMAAAEGWQPTPWVQPWRPEPVPA